MKKPVLFVIAFFLYGPLSASVESHEHGVAEIKSSREGKSWKIEIEVPIVSLIGFEECAQTPDQKRKVQNLADRTTQSNLFLAWSPEAQCTPRGFSRESEILNKPCALPEGHHDSLIAKFELHCQSPDRLKTLTVKDKSLFKDIKRFKYQIISHSQSFIGEMNPQQTQINLQ